ncbi:GNAT family N-acetyltransferase [Anaerolineales bacterium]
MTEYQIRPLEREDREWVAHFLDDHWGTTQIVSRGKAVYGHLLPGFVAQAVEPAEGEKPYLGLLTYNRIEKECEVMTLDSLVKKEGIASALVDAFKSNMKEAGCKRLWLITTNDNLDALRFWQKRGFELVSVHRNAINEARRIKPQIPILGYYGIPIRDEIELELTF